ncbi:IS110 family transposase [Gemmatimonas sp.]|uniref:IS110 family transposase n=1 Tax=Gemmatimonas sp. TaxID=1962908 RepID=UPI003342DDFB
MDSIGFDLHLRESQLCVLGDDGTAQQRRIATTVAGLNAFFAARAPAQIVLEASTESEWVAQHLEQLGHAVRVADPNDARLYAGRSRHIKTDARDARALAEAARRHDWHVAYRPSAARRRLRQELAGRELLVRTRTRLQAQLRCLVRAAGQRVPPAKAETFAERAASVPLPDTLAPLRETLLTVHTAVQAQVLACTERLTALGRADVDVVRAMTAPGVGIVTASAYVAALDDVTRFPSGEQVACYLGLVPRERSSSESRRLGGITKAGDTRVRWLLVEAAWTIRRGRSAETAALRAWCQRVERRRGRSVAVVALARRLAVILYTMWRTGRDYEAARLRGAAGGTA